MTSPFASRVSLVEGSPTLAITAKAKALNAQGIRVVGFGAGEPDFDTPEHIKEAARAALARGETKYTPNTGTPELKKAILKRIAEDYGVSDYEPANVIVSSGAKHTLWNLMYALVDEGDEVLVPAPYWVSYPAQVKMLKGVPVALPTDARDGFRLHPEAVREALDSAERRGARAKVLILNSPSNPTGAMYPRADLEKIAEIALSAGLWIVSDDIYQHVAYGEVPFFSVASLGKEVRERTIVVNGVSKAYSMTGWRIGYAVCDKRLVAAMDDIQSQMTSNASSISQAAAAVAIGGPQDCIRPMVAEFKRRRDYIVDRLNKMPGVRCRLPAGAFYVFPDVSGLFGKKANGKTLDSGNAVTEYLLETARVAVVPGEGFGDGRFVRLSYATGMDAVAEGMNLMEKALAAL